VYIMTNLIPRPVLHNILTTYIIYSVQISKTIPPLDIIKEYVNYQNIFVMCFGFTRSVILQFYFQILFHLMEINIKNNIYMYMYIHGSLFCFLNYIVAVL